MGVLETQRVRRRKGNRYTRKDCAETANRTTGWNRRMAGAARAEAHREPTHYRVEPRERSSRVGPLLKTAAAAAVYAAGVVARWGWRATRAAFAAAVGLATLAWRGLIATLRGMGFAAGFVVRSARPHVQRGARTSLEAGKQGARASAQLGRRAASYSAVQMRTQADDMRDGFPDVRQGATLARRGAASIRVSVVDTLRRRGWLARPPWRRVLRHAGVAAGAMGLAWILAVGAVVVPPAMVRSGALAVDDIDVTGCDRVDPDEILAAAGVEPGDNLLAVELARVADDVRALPWIENVQLRRRYPNRFCITVVERRPALLLADEGLWFVDPGGEVFKRVDAEEWIDLPVVTGLSLDDRVVDPEGCRKRLREAVGLVEAFDLSRSMDAGDIGELHLLPSGGFLVRTTQDGVVLRLDEEDFRRGLSRLDTLLERDLLSLVAVERVDLSLRNQVVATRRADL